MAIKRRYIIAPIGAVTAILIIRFGYVVALLFLAFAVVVAVSLDSETNKR